MGEKLIYFSAETVEQFPQFCPQKISKILTKDALVKEELRLSNVIRIFRYEKEDRPTLARMKN